MQFEDLKQLFNVSFYIELESSDLLSSDIKGKYVKIDKIPGSNNLYLRQINENGNDFNTLVYCVNVYNEKDNEKLDKYLRFRYFAKVVFVTDKKIGLDIVCFDRIDIFEEPFSIGVADGALKGPINTIEKYKSMLTNDFLLKIDGKQYYIFANHIHNNGKAQFAIVNSSKMIFVSEKRRKDCGVCDCEKEDELIFAVTDPLKSFRKDDYNFTLTDAEIIIDNITSADFAAKQNAVFIHKDLEKYVTNWQVYCKMELEYALDKKAEAGSLLYDKKTETQDEVVFEIKNCGDIDKFLEILEPLRNPQNNIDDLVVSGDISCNGKNKDTSVRLKLKSRKGDSLICFRKQNVTFTIPKSGNITISTIGFETQYKRRQYAINRILSSASAMPNLAMLLSGTGALHKDRNIDTAWSMETRALFGGHRPTDRQIEAIEIAINTPDIAIIQGPPGTGKTKVINAIQQRISDIEKDKTLAFGKNLLTAYQQKATKNMAKDLRVYGLPTISIVGDTYNDEIILDNQFTSWWDAQVEQINKENADIYFDVKKRKSKENFYQIFQRYSVSDYTYENNYTELKRLLITVDESMTSNFRFEIENCIEEAENQLVKYQKKYISSDVGYAKNIPTSITSYSDDGEKLIDDIILRLEDVDNISADLKELKKCFSQEHIDFSMAKTIKNRIITSLMPKNVLIIPKEFNERVYQLLQKINENIESCDACDEDKIMSDYVEAFNYNPFQIRSSIDKFLTVIAATHQKSVDKTIMQKKTSEEESELIYDNVLIDEAARSCPPDLLIPMCCARDRIILVGDHKQLPQLIDDEIYENLNDTDMSSEEKEAFKQTMFERLVANVQKLTERDGIKRFTTLDTQFRMKGCLGDFISRNFYEEDGVQIKSVLPDSAFSHYIPGLQNKSMVWMDVRGETENEKLKYTRKKEAERIAALLKTILDSPECEKLTIGIMSFYKKQINLIKECLLDPKINICEKIDNKTVIRDKYKTITQDDGGVVDRVVIDTVDAFQGLENDIVILSMTRSQKLGRDKPARFGFLGIQNGGKNRLCVALSRQKRCLIIAGDSDMLKAKNAIEDIPALVDFYNTCSRGGDEVAII